MQSGGGCDCCDTLFYEQEGDHDFDTDIPGGSHVGFVAMIEVVALMIGDIVQCYSADNMTILATSLRDVR